jgi:glycosidase
LYSKYIFTGKFDYLYDKVGLYDSIKRLTRDEPGSTTWAINSVWNNDCRGIDQHMLRFMENHDEQRIASRYFAGNPWLALPGMIVSATLSTGPVMVYFGQEVGEPAEGIEGFSGEDGRTTIFDYWGVPEHQKWLNNGNFDGGLLSDSQKALRNFYSRLLNAVRSSDALSDGKFYELMLVNEHQQGFNQHLYIFLRYNDNQRILVVANFNRNDISIQVKLPGELLNGWNLSGNVAFADLLSGNKYVANNIADGVPLALSASSGLLLEF